MKSWCGANDNPGGVLLGLPGLLLLFVDTCLLPGIVGRRFERIRRKVVCISMLAHPVSLPRPRDFTAR
eukprot:2975075-Pyramimonas_sp.AAC.1